MKKIDQLVKCASDLNLTLVDVDITEFVKSNLSLDEFSNSFDESYLIGKLSNDMFELEIQLYRSGSDLWLKDFELTAVNDILNVTCDIEKVIDILKPFNK